MKTRILSTMLLLCALTMSAIAQKTATVKNFSLTTDHVAGVDRRSDLNGDPCALVKIQVVDGIKRIEGNRIGDVIDKGVEKWVYMCKGSRNMKIHLNNHLPLKVMFQDYNINGLESNRVYELIIETPDVPASATSQKLTLNYNPANAMVLIDSKPYKGNGRIEALLPVGEHKYIIAADGYITAEGVIKLNEFGEGEMTVNLTADKNVVVEPIPMSDAVVPERPSTNLPKETILNTNVSGLKRGFRGYLEVGYSLGLSDDDDGCGLARVALGYQFSPYVFTGLGAGIGLYDEFEDLGVPIFVAFRYTILNKRISPYIDLKAGFAPEIDDDDYAGPFASPTLGCRFALGKRLAINSGVSGEFQGESFGIALKVGIDF